VVCRKKDGDNGLCYGCQKCEFDCVGKKSIVNHVKEEHEEEFKELLALFKGKEANLIKIVMNAPLVEGEAKLTQKKTNDNNGVNDVQEKTQTVEQAKKKDPKGRKEYPVTLDVLRMIDARVTNIPNYGSLVGRVARLLAVIMGKEVTKKVGKEVVKKDGEDGDDHENGENGENGENEENGENGEKEKDENGEKEKDENGEGDEEDETVDLHCYKCNMDVEGSYSDIMPHLEKKHQDFLDILLIMFPPAEKRMAQFMETAARKFELRVPSEKEVEDLMEKAKLEEEEKERLEEEEEAAQRKLRGEESKEEQEAAAAKKKSEMDVVAAKRKSEADSNDKNTKVAKTGGSGVGDIDEIKQAISSIQRQLKDARRAFRGGRGGWGRQPNPARIRDLERKLQVWTEKRRKYWEVKNLETKILESSETRLKELEARTETLLKDLSPKQVRKLCMNYFSGLAEEDGAGWKETLESMKMEDDYFFVGDFLSLLYDYARHYEKKGFKLGHMLVTNKQSELVFEKGMRSLKSGMIDDKAFTVNFKNLTAKWLIPSKWDLQKPDEELGEEWGAKEDSLLLIGAAKFGRNLSMIVRTFLSLKEKVQDEKSRKIKKSVKERFAYLLNVYQHRGKYNEEFGLSLYTEDLLLEDDCKTLLGVAEDANMKDNSVEEVSNGDASAENAKDAKVTEDEIEEVTLGDSDSDTEAPNTEDKKRTSADEDDSDEAEEEDSAPKKSKRSKPKSKVEPEASADEESGEDDEEPAPKKTNTKGNKKRKAEEVSADEEESEEEEESPPKKANKKSSPKKKVVKEASADEESEDGDEDSAPKKDSKKTNDPEESEEEDIESFDV